MTQDDDPLWYDRAEPDEPLNIFTMTLISAFAVGEFFYVGVMSLYRTCRGGVAVAFRDVRP
jgi:hypothetical protein